MTDLQDNSGSGAKVALTTVPPSGSPTPVGGNSADSMMGAASAQPSEPSLPAPMASSTSNGSTGVEPSVAPEPQPAVTPEPDVVAEPAVAPEPEVTTNGGSGGMATSEPDVAPGGAGGTGGMGAAGAAMTEPDVPPEPAVTGGMTWDTCDPSQAASACPDSDCAVHPLCEALAANSDTYGHDRCVQWCTGFIQCAAQHDGCVTADDPLCVGDYNSNGVCFSYFTSVNAYFDAPGYQAAAELVGCACGN